MNRYVMVKKAAWTFGLLLMLGVTVAAYGFSRTGERADCPGKVACPLTGEEVCKDQCPLVDADRIDCPGKAECPLTGKLVCEDKCPLSTDSKIADAAEEFPACCRDRK